MAIVTLSPSTFIPPFTITADVAESTKGLTA